MSDKEERLLVQDSGDVHSRTPISHTKLANAIRSGMAEGKRREMKRRTALFGAGTAAAAAAALWITISPPGAPLNEKKAEYMQTAATLQPVEMESFRPIAEHDQGLKAALDQGLVKPINESIEKDGFRIDIAGAVTDGRKAYILYRAQNDMDHTAFPIIDYLAFGGVEASTVRAQSMHATGGNELLPGETGYYAYTANLEPGVAYKEGADIGLKIWDTVTNEYRSHLAFTIPLEPNLLQDKERVYETEHVLDVNGQNINITRLQFTPLHTYVDFEYDASNDMQIFKLLNPVLIGEQGERREKLYYPDTMLLDDAQISLVFGSSELDQMDVTSLKVAGIAAVPKDDMQITIDLNRGEIVEAPDRYVQIVEPEEPAADGEILLRYRRGQAMATESFGLWLNSYYTDAEGNRHELLSPETIKSGGHMVSSKDDLIEDYNVLHFGAEARRYPQPLTVGILKYWNPVVEWQSVELISRP